MESFIIRQATSDDVFLIFDLYLQVTAQDHGLARSFQEINLEYICHFSERAQKKGIQLLLINPKNPNQILGEIHACPSETNVFKHVLSDVTLVVHPSIQSQGWGRRLFQYLIDQVIHDHLHITRIELFCRESNTRAIKLYEQLGFLQEGRFENRIALDEHNFEADIPLAWFRK
ncbi:MAG TPA: GNAT family N-acetyltransferase [Flavobacteriales bacterium]|nr:GNAT family N-acetyltransferase [Flavobacteriales bacterium]